MFNVLAILIRKGVILSVLQFFLAILFSILFIPEPYWMAFFGLFMISGGRFRRRAVSLNMYFRSLFFIFSSGGILME